MIKIMIRIIIKIMINIMIMIMLDNLFIYFNISLQSVKERLNN